MKATAHNMPKKDARLLYTMDLASRRAHYRLRGARRDFFGQDVSRNARHFNKNGKLK